MALSIAHADGGKSWKLGQSFFLSLATHLTFLAAAVALALSSYRPPLIFSPVTTVNLVASLDRVRAERSALRTHPVAPVKKSAAARKPVPSEMPPLADKSKMKASETPKPPPPGAEENKPRIQAAAASAPAPPPPAPPVQKSGPSAALAPQGSGLSLDTANFPFGYYLVLLHRRISEAWDPGELTDPTAGEKVTVYFRILRDGSAKDIRIEKASADPALNQLAVKAVSAALPFPPLPEDFHDDSLGVHFIFELPSTM